jgi:hypothetical protein
MIFKVMKKIIILVLILSLAAFSTGCGKKTDSRSKKRPTEQPPVVNEMATWMVFAEEESAFDSFNALVMGILDKAANQWAPDARLQIVSSVVDKDLTQAQYFFNFYSQVKKDQGECANLFAYYNDQYQIGDFEGRYNIHSGTGKPQGNTRLFAYTPIKPEVCQRSEVKVGELDAGKLQLSALEILRKLSSDPGQTIQPNSVEDGTNG